MCEIETMPATIPTHDVDPITTISKEMAKHIRYLEGNVERLRRLPKSDDILSVMKNELWHKLCKVCRSNMLSSNNFSAWTEGRNTSGPLEEQQMIEELKSDNAVLGNIIKEKDKKIKEFEEKIKRNTKEGDGKIKLANVQKKNERKVVTGGIRIQANEDITISLDEPQWFIVNWPRDDLDEKQMFYDKIHEEKDDCIREVAQLKMERQTLRDKTGSLNRTVEDLSSTLKAKVQNIDKLKGEIGEMQRNLDNARKENEWAGIEIEDLQTERQTLQDQTDSLNMIKEELSSTLKTKEQDVNNLRGELDKKQEAYNKIHEKKEQCMREVSQLQAERQTLQDQTDSLNRTVEDLLSTLKTKQQIIDKLTGELDEKQKAYDKIHEERQECMREVTQLQAERQTLQDQTDVLNRTVGDVSSTLKAGEQKLNKLTGELDEKQAAYNRIHEEKKECMTELSQLQTERQTLQDQTDSLNKIKEELSSTLKTKEQDVNNLRKELDGKQEAYNKIYEDKQECMREVSQLQTNRKTLQDQTDSLYRTVEDLSSMFKAKQKNIDKLTGELEKKQKAYEKLQKVTEQCMREVSQLQRERQTLQDQTDSLNRTVKDLSSTLKTKEQNIEKLTGELEEKQIDFEKTAQKEKDKYGKEHSELQQKNVELQNQSDTLTKTNKELSSTIVDLERDIDKLTWRLEENQYECDRVKHENDEYRSDINAIQTERRVCLDTSFHIEKLMTAIKSLHLKVDKLTEEKQCDLDRCKEESERYTGEIAQLQREIKSIFEQLRSIKCITEGFRQDFAGLLAEPAKQEGNSSTDEIQRFKKKMLVMRLLRTSRSCVEKATVDIITKELTRQVEGILDSSHFDFSVGLHETSKGVTEGPLFVASPNEMVERNIQDALEGPKGGRDVYLLVLHQTTRENVSTLRPDSLRNTGTELRQLGGVIDILFSSESGLFECDINSTAVAKIVTVLKEY